MSESVCWNDEFLDCYSTKITHISSVLWRLLSHDRMVARWCINLEALQYSALCFTPTLLFTLSGLQQHRTSGDAIQPELLLWPQPQRGKGGPCGHRRTQSVPEPSRGQRGAQTCWAHGQVSTGLRMCDIYSCCSLLECLQVIFVLF